MLKAKDGGFFITDWLRNRNTIEYLGLWESINNPIFKGVEFDTFMNEAGANRFNMTPRKWIDATNAIGIISNPDRNARHQRRLVKCLKQKQKSVQIIS